MKQQTIILLSGGIDSMAVAKFYLDLDHSVVGLFIDYGQKAVNQENLASSAVADFFQIQKQTAKIHLPNLNSYKSGFIQGRNLLLLSTAISSYEGETGCIAIGIHSGTGYSDCTKSFIEKSKSLCDIYFDGRVTVESPFVNWTKKDIYEYSIDNNLPIDLTYSCENGKKIPCGFCSSCKDKETLYASKI